MPSTNNKISKQKNIRKYTCDYCKYDIRLKADLLKHMQEKHIAHEKTNAPHNSGICSYCGKFYTSAARLRDHTLTHTNTRPFPCTECGHRFYTNRQLKMHTIRIHTMERPYHCQICGKNFVVKYELKIHMISHTGQKDAQCKICLRFFRDKKKLKQHSVVHTGAKPFQCRSCELVFAY